MNTYKTFKRSCANWREFSEAKARDWFREGSAGDNHFAESVEEDAKTVFEA